MVIHCKVRGREVGVGVGGRRGEERFKFSVTLHLETIRTIELRTATLTFTQLLSSEGEEVQV